MIPVIRFTSCSHNMTSQYVNSFKYTILYILLTLAIISINLMLLFGFVYNQVVFGSAGSLPTTTTFNVLMGIAIGLYILFLLCISYYDIINIGKYIYRQYSETFNATDKNSMMYAMNVYMTYRTGYNKYQE